MTIGRFEVDLASTEGAKGDLPSQPLQALDSDEFEALDCQLRPKLLRIAWVIVRDWSLAADAVQVAFLTLHQKWSEVMPDGRPGWLVKTVQYSAHNIRRMQASQAKLPELLFNRSLADHSLMQSSQADLEQLNVALQELPEQQRQIVQMRLVDGLTFKQIAASLSIPLGTALSRMRLAVEKLRLVLDGQKNE